jgi:hypothetical protein
MQYLAPAFYSASVSASARLAPLGGLGIRGLALETSVVGDEISRFA